MDKPPNISPDEAFERLVAGNARFVSGKSTPHPHTPDQLARLAEAQHPFATILGCSDSRVAPEMVFDQDLGDLFIVRVAGNVVGAEVLGSLGYALQHLSTPLFVVLGHEGCGAVTAAWETKFGGEATHERLAPLLNAISPALEQIDCSEPRETQLRQAVEWNVRLEVKQLSATDAARPALAEGRIRIVGAVYELNTGRVRFLEGDNT